MLVGLKEKDFLIYMILVIIATMRLRAKGKKEKIGKNSNGEI